MSQSGSESVDEGEIKCWVDGGCDINNLDAFGHTPMHRAVDMGSLEVVRRVYDSVREKYGTIASHEQVGKAIQSLTNVKGSSDITPLHCAAMNGDEEMVELLLRQGADIGALDSKVGWTPLHCAAMSGQLSVMELLIAKAKELSRTDYLNQADGTVGWTPLHCASIGGHQAIVESCFEEMVDAKRKDRAGWTALDLAILNRHEAVIQVLRGPDSGQCTFFWSAEDVLNVQQRKKRHQLMNGKKWTGFHLAAVHYQGRTIRSWLEHHQWSAEELEYDVNALQVAVACGLYNTVSLFLPTDLTSERAREEKVYATVIGCLEDAMHVGFARVVKRLMDGGIDKETKIRQAPLLLLALAYKRIAVAQTLLSFGVNPNPPVHDSSLLHNLIVANYLSGVRLLLNHGADIEAKNKSGQTLLIAATKKFELSSKRNERRMLSSKSVDSHDIIEPGPKKLIQLLLDHKADVQVQDHAGWTPLLHAVRSGNRDLVKQLLEKGASVATEGPHHESNQPLFHAIEYRHAEIVQLLLENGAGEFCPTHLALFAAIDRSDEAIVAILLDNGADTEEKYEEGYKIPLRFISTERILGMVPFPEETTGWLFNGLLGETPLIQAVLKGGEAIVRLLLDRNIDVNATDSNGHSALFYADQEGHGKIVELLLARGARTDLEN